MKSSMAVLPFTVLLPAFLAEASVDHQAPDTFYQIAWQTLSQGLAALPQAGTRPRSLVSALLQDIAVLSSLVSLPLERL